MRVNVAYANIQIQGSACTTGDGRKAMVHHTAGIYTISKFGGKPLAEAPLNDVQMFYQSGNYAVYSTN